MQLPYNFLNAGDFIDLIYEVRRKGITDFFHRFRLNNSSRVVNTWDCIDKGSSDWWIIPLIRKRWNEIISGNPEVEYEDYVANKYFKNKANLTLLSIGSGGGTPEIKFANHDCFSTVLGIDISKKIVEHAAKKAEKFNLKNLKFLAADAYAYDFGINCYDAILFHSSLHHFSKLDFLLQKTKDALNEDGILIIHEYTGPDRFQWKSEQLQLVNKIFKNDLPGAYKEKRIKGFFKRKIYKPGKLRMFLSDPSEAVHSSDILTIIYKYFFPAEEKQLGGCLLHPLLKDISHHFINGDMLAEQLLQKLIEKENTLLKQKGESDFIFGVYKKKKLRA